MIKADHKAALQWATDNTDGRIHPGPSDENLAVCYLEARGAELQWEKMYYEEFERAEAVKRDYERLRELAEKYVNMPNNYHDAACRARAALRAELERKS